MKTVYLFHDPNRLEGQAFFFPISREDFMGSIGKNQYVIAVRSAKMLRLLMKGTDVLSNNCWIKYLEDRNIDKSIFL